MTAYLDSSAAFKLFVEDEGDREDPWQALSMFGLTLTNRLTYVETRAALAAARRGGRVSRRTSPPPSIASNTRGRPSS